MAIELSVHPDRALSYFRFSGSVTVQDCARIYRTYVRHPLFDKQFMMLSNTINTKQPNPIPRVDDMDTKDIYRFFCFARLKRDAICHANI